MSEPNQPVDDASMTPDTEAASEQALESNAAENAAPEATASQEGAKAKPRVHPKDVVARFATAWPEAFSTDPKAVKPLTVGVLKQILANRPAELDGLNSQAIRAGMKYYASRMAYHIAVLNHSHRVDLAGEQAEEITDDMRTHAQEQLDAIKALRAEKSGKADGDKPRKKGSGPRRKGPRDGDAAEGRSTGGRRKKGPQRSSDRRRHEAGGRGQAAEAPKMDENLSMEEKLARLAERFGK
jgi:ProP effector